MSKFTCNRYLSVSDELDNKVLEVGSGTDVFGEINSPLGRSCPSPDTTKGLQISPLLWPCELKLFGDELIPFHEDKDSYFNNKVEISGGLSKKEETKIYGDVGQSSTEKRMKNKRSQANELDGIIRKVKMQKIGKSLWSHEYLLGVTEINKEKNVEDIKAERAIRNRESARRSRMRTKMYFEKLEQAFEQLQKENRILKLIIAKEIPECMRKVKGNVVFGNNEC